VRRFRALLAELVREVILRTVEEQLIEFKKLRIGNERVRWRRCNAKEAVVDIVPLVLFAWVCVICPGDNGVSVASI